MKRRITLATGMVEAPAEVDDSQGMPSVVECQGQHYLQRGDQGDEALVYVLTDVKPARLIEKPQAGTGVAG